MGKTTKIWLIGAGQMAKAYVSVLEKQNFEFDVIGRGKKSGADFENATGIKVIEGIEKAMKETGLPTHAIVTVSIEELAVVTEKLVDLGCKNILVEKPGALFKKELEKIQTSAEAKNANVWIAYNRRYYASVNELRNKIEKDGGIVSANFEFTEWAHEISELEKGQRVKNRWLLANSSHVLDLVFSMIGIPREGEWKAWNLGSINWHPYAARFHGAGISEMGIPFSYNADWEAPGRWGVEFLTKKNRYILRPMEKLHVIKTGSVTPVEVPIDDKLDRNFKPGLYLQCRDFMNNKSGHLCNLRKHLEAFDCYIKIAGYEE